MIKSNCLLNTYESHELQITHGQDNWLYDASGKRYLDAISSMGVAIIGHNCPAVSSSIAAQANKLIHASNIFYNQPQQILAERLVELSQIGDAQVFFNNSGAEAMETAIKGCKLFAKQQGFNQPQIIVMSGGYHGRTMSTLSASDLASNNKFSPLVDGYIQVQFNDCQSLEQAMQQPQIVGVVVESIQGAGGINPASVEFMQCIRKLCDKQGCLMICDEVQAGLGRTGKSFGYMHSGVTPDIVTVAKGLANGVPIGACILHERIAKLFNPGMHGSTFGGNALATSAALATLNYIQQHNLTEKARLMGEQLLSKLQTKLATVKNVCQVRGQGLMLAVELYQAIPNIAAKILHQGVICNQLKQGKVIRLLPPLTLQEQELDLIVDAVLVGASGIEPPTTTMSR